MLGIGAILGLAVLVGLCPTASAPVGSGPTTSTPASSDPAASTPAGSDPAPSTPVVDLANLGIVPYAAGSSAANIPVRGGTTRVLLRFVSRQTGPMTRLYVQAKVATPGCVGHDGGAAGYAGGSTGIFEVSVFGISPKGTPAGPPLALASVRPCASTSRGSLPIPLQFDAVQGREYGVIFRNVDPNPEENWASVNFLYSATGIVGANGRNERNPGALDNVYGLDPRELVGYSVDQGTTWQLPGGPYGPSGGRAFLPTFIQEFGDGTRAGQPYYYATTANGSRKMVYASASEPRTITSIGAHTFAPGSSTVRLLVDGTERAQVELSGIGWIRGSITPVLVPAGARVEISLIAGESGLDVRSLQADAAWTNLLQLSTGPPYSLLPDGTREGPLTIYPLTDSQAPLPPKVATAPAKVFG